METSIKIINMISQIVAIIIDIEIIVSSYSKEQIAITVIVVLLLAYLIILIAFYVKSKKNHSYGSKSDSENK